MNSGRVAEVVKAALELEPAERASYLDQACGLEKELRAEVESLLGFQQEASDFIEQPALHVAAQTLATQEACESEETIAGYRVLSKLGEGGMGTVYLAEDLELGRKVALKLVRPSMSTAEVLSRFHYEEQILASLNHPNIGQLYGGGATADGTPFFVMEYVEGMRIDEFCRRENLTTTARLDLFRKVCSAIHYAHQHLVIHRDVKPSNILVTLSSEPKLLDFGIAKLLDPQESDASPAPTLLGVMTPDYASPEQVRGEPITTASDVYSLGVILYELLTDTRPYRTKSRMPAEIARAVTDQEPTWPSLACGASLQLASFRNLQSRATSLRGDLDNIVLMALRKEPSRRYTSVAQFSDDIRRHLEHRPVIARKDSWRYRSGKFVRRNRVAVAAGLLLILSLVSGLIATVHQGRIAARERDRAQRRFADVRQLSNALLFDISPKIERLEGSTEARASLVQRALEYLDSLAKESADDLHLQAELAAAYEKVGELQGNPRKPNLGDFAGAIASYEKAREIRSRLSGRNPTDREMLRRYAQDLTTLSAIRFWTSDTAGSLNDSEKSLAAYENLLAGEPDSVELALSRAESQVDLGYTHYYNDRLAQAYQPLREAIASLERLRPRLISNPELLRLLGRAYTGLSMTLSWDGKQAEGEKEMAKAIEVGESLVAEHPHDNVLRQGLLDTYQQSSQLFEDNDPARSLEILGKAQKLAETTAANDPADLQAQQNVAKVYSRLGVISLHLGKLDSAVEFLDRAANDFAELAKKEPAHRAYQHDRGRVLMFLGETQQQQKKFDAALASYAKAAALFEEAARVDPRNNMPVRKLATVYTYIGETHRDIAGTMVSAEREQHRLIAQENFHHALNIYTQLKAQQALTDYDQKEMEAVRVAVEAGQ